MILYQITGRALMDPDARGGTLREDLECRVVAAPSG
jgi:hypothetical protein